jgi:hypothetical protein|tara:strand:- start:26 stop:499 length:474 start_codon:yes stop_codon:yes gene_type:complete
MSDIKYYVVGGEAQSTIDSLLAYQGIDQVDILSSINEAWRVPYDQGFEGIAVVATSHAELKESFDPSEYVDPGKLMYHTPCKNVFVVNCSQSKFTTVDLNNLDAYSGFDMGGPVKWVKSNKLAKLFNLEIEENTDPTLSFESDAGWSAPEPELKDEE